MELSVVFRGEAEFVVLFEEVVGFAQRGCVGHTYLHCAVDDHSRVAYVEAHDNEKADTLVGFWAQDQDWFFRVHDYNHHRNHTAVGGPPASRFHNVCGSYN